MLLADFRHQLFRDRRMMLLLLLLLAAVSCTPPDQDSLEAPKENKGTIEERLAALNKPHALKNSSPAENSGPKALSQPNRPPAQNPPAVQNPKPNPLADLSRSRVTVQIFTEGWSTHCKELENFLVENKIKYIKYDVAKDRNAKQYAHQLAGDYSVPVVLVGNKVIRGIDLAAIQAAVRKYVPKSANSFNGYSF